MPFTFKKNAKLTGLAAVGEPYQSSVIKLNKKDIGSIDPTRMFESGNLWSVSFRIEKSVLDENPNCSWKSISLKKKFESDEAARIFLNENFQVLVEKFKFHPLD